MTYLLLTISLLIPLAVGYYFICIFWPDTGVLRENFLIRCFLGVGLGFGISSLVFFVWLLLIGPSIIGLVIVEIALLISLFYKTRVPAADPASLPPLTKQPVWRTLTISFYIVTFCALLSFILISLKNPHGRWDAWVVWNMRARFIFKGGEHWKDLFSQHLFWSHPDYPLLISATIARCWKIIGSDILAVPAIISMFFTFATAGLVFSGLSVVRDKTQGYLAGTVLLATPFFIEHGASQYADVPLGFFFLATLVLFSLYRKLEDPNLLFLAGVASGLALWTKNEGFLFMVAIIIGHIMATVPAKGVKKYLKETLPFAIGILPILCTTLYLKIFLAQPNNLISSQNYQATIEKLTDLSRYKLVGHAFMDRIVHSGGWITSVTFLLLFYILFMGIKIEEKQKMTLMTSSVTLCLMLAGYFIVYIITPYDLHWYLLHALGRLLLQLYPGLIFTLFLVAGSPKTVGDYAAGEK